MVKTEVTVFFDSTLEHMHQLYCGFALLEKQGEIRLRYVTDRRNIPAHLLRVEIAGKRVVFDMADGSTLTKPYVDEADYYVKRMLLRADLERSEKLIPFGLAYPVFAHNLFLATVFRKDRKLLPFSMRYWPVIPALMGVMDNVDTGHHTRFRHSAGQNRKVIFSSKLWQPENVNDTGKRLQRIEINQERIDLVRELRRALGDDFVGGIRRDELSQMLSPDVLIDRRQSHKAYYRKVLAGCGVGVANAGLEDSIGFKFAEYVANGSALLTNDISKYALPGGFEEGVHYLTYRNVSDCVDKVGELLANDRARIAMGKANERYYDDVLEPATNMKRVIGCVLGAPHFER